LYNPSRMKEHFKVQGIGLIFAGYLCFIIYLLM
jgi:preprotein translocase subunit Sss1